MLKKVRRFDKGRLDGVEVTPSGFLRAPAYATKAGIFIYQNMDGTKRRELRPPEEVFKEDSLRSLSGVPVTDDHPQESLISSENAKKYMRGFTGDQVIKDGEFVKTWATITDQDLIEKVKGGKVEVSCGYECEHEETPGVFNGQPYDVIQRNIQYNHLAVVDRGRAGREARLRLDSDAEMVNDDEEEPMKLVKVKIGDTEFEVSEAAAAQINGQNAKIETIQGELDGLKSESAKLTAAKADAEAKLATEKSEKEKVQARADSLSSDLEKAKTAGDEKVVEERVKTRVKLLAVGSELLPAEKAAKMDSMSDLEIKKEVILADSPQADLKEKSEVYVAARFDSIVDSYESKGKKFNQIGKAITTNRADTATTDEEKAKKAQTEKSKDLWKEPLAATK